MKIFWLFSLSYLVCKSTCAHNTTRILLQVLEHYQDKLYDVLQNNTQCADQLKIYLTELVKTEMWALKMMDSSAKLPPGLLTGNVIFVGNYDECLEIDVVSNRTRIQGQYCTALIRPKLEAQICARQKLKIDESRVTELEPFAFFNWDICVPAICSANDLQQLWNFLEERYQIPMHSEFQNNLCSSVEKQNSYTQLEIIAISIFFVIGAIVLLSTVYDVLIFQRRKCRNFNFFMSFSYYTNFKRLISTKTIENVDVPCLHGIRVISMAWIIVGHSYLYDILFVTAINNFHIIEWMQQDQSMIIEGALACVDSFLVMSGFLIVYITMLAKEKGVTINLFVFWFHRFLRLLPGLAAIILVYVGILRHLGYGPLWNMIVEYFQQHCRTQWWSSLFFVENYVNPVNTCMAQGWYLAVDSQLYFLSPLIFLPFQRWPKVTIVFVIALIGASFASVVYVTIHYDINHKSFKELFDFYEFVYNPTHTRATPWLIGTLLGYFMFKTRHKKIKIKMSVVIFLWILTIVSMLGTMYQYTAFFKHSLSTLSTALFFGYSHVVWGFCISWVIFACSRGYGGYINTFLSHPIFRVLSRLTYSLYLTHFVMIFIIRGQRATNAHLNNLFSFHDFWGNFAFSVGISVIWTLTFESPISILESVLIKRELQKKEDINKSV